MSYFVQEKSKFDEFEFEFLMLYVIIHTGIKNPNADIYCLELDDSLIESHVSISPSVERFDKCQHFDIDFLLSKRGHR